jgi:uncharacterized membrane protein YfcA
VTGLDVYVILVVFAATVVRSAFGFGEALIAVPLLALRLPIQTAAPLAVLVSVTVSIIVMAQDWRDVHFASAAWLVLATLAGIPVGLWLLTHANERLVKAGLALGLVAFSAFSLRGRTSWHLAADRVPWLLGCGFAAGALGGAYGMNGPPLAIYGALRRWPAARFRATLQAYFLPASLLGMLGYWLGGLWVPRVTHDYLLSIPATVVGTLLGRVLHRRFGAGDFLRYVYGGLILIGGVLLFQAVR